MFLSFDLLKTKKDGALHTQGSNFFMKIVVQIGQSLDRRNSLQFNVWLANSVSHQILF